MDLPSHELQAFRMISQTRSFSAAAERIHITQPALTQRIQSLERTLGLTLVIRNRKGIKLTEAGQKLLRYCQVKEHLESELLADLGAVSVDAKLAGRLRIAGYSSVLHSVIMPSLAELLRENQDVQFEFSMHEMGELFGVLDRGEADFVVIDHAIRRDSIEAVTLGEEQYVFVRSSEFPAPNVYLDHDTDDRLTETFLKQQGQKPKDFKRCYVDDIQGILQGVALGLGQGVIPRHLLRENLPLQVVPTKKPMTSPVVLHYFRQSYYSKLQKITVETLRRNAKAHLG